MRKFFALTLALLMILALAACKSTTEDPEKEPEDTPEVSDSESEELTPPESGDETTDTSETEPSTETDEPQELEFKEVNETVYIYGTNTLNVRKEPSADSEKMGEMKEGEQVTRIGYNSEWSKISYYGNEYYASSNYLTTHAPLEFEDKTDTVYIVAEGTLYLRQKPSANSDAVAYLPYGTALDRTGIATTEDEFGTVWSRLLYNGQVCYASTTHLSTEEPTNDFTAVDETVYVVDKNGDTVVISLNLRAKPSLNSNVVVAVAPGTQLKRVGIAADKDDDDIIWSKIIYNGITCYASSGYLTTEAPAAEETPETTNEAE
ncbi:MAG: SH3 domain-containing protein [Clostridia bacterium]|nr:SH3 domain-containing protein [Clostridia bacterium]